MVYVPDDNGTNVPWVFARVLGIYHANILLPGTSKLQRVEFMHVHWFDQEILHAAGPHVRRLERIQLRSPSISDSFSFIDPNTIIRSTHLIPAFHHGQTNDLTDILGTEDNWKYYYVNR
jgi:hypothetical protein